MRRWIIAIIVLVLVGGAAFIAWTAATNRAETAGQQAVAEALAAQEAARRLDAPYLLNPADGATFDNVAAARLQWDWTRPLAEDEVFDVRVWQEGEPAYGITWTTESEFDLTKWLLDRQPGEYFWTVAVMQKNADGTSATEISDLAPQRRFTITDIQLDIMDGPAGFEVELYARLPLPEPTVITFGDDGDLYVLSLSGQITRVSDDDGDGVAENAQIIYADEGDQIFHAVGMAFYEDQLYVSYSGKIGIMSDADMDDMLDTVTPIVEGLPSWQHTFHSNNGIAFGPDGKLYVGVGATTDHGPLHDPLEAAILRMNPDGSDLEVFAGGFRNPYDLAFSSAGELFTSDNSPDEPDHDLQYLPPEEIDYVREGLNYGFPTAYGNLRPDDSTEPPITELFTSSASSGITYYDADQFPPDYHGIYLAQFGSGSGYAKATATRTGQMVVFVKPERDGERYTGTWQPFVTFRHDLGIYSPIDVTVGPDGALYVAEWITRTVFRVTYTGETVEAEATAEITTQADADVLASGEDIYRNGTNGAPACIVCHLLDNTATGTGPSLVGLSERIESRVPGMSAEEYVRQSILNPNDYIVEGFSANFMYQNYAQDLSKEEVEVLIAYVLSLSQP
jgi:putative membrane-bound dehydrogenase-like protein